MLGLELGRTYVANISCLRIIHIKQFQVKEVRLYGYTLAEKDVPSVHTVTHSNMHTYYVHIYSGTCLVSTVPSLVHTPG